MLGQAAGITPAGRTGGRKMSSNSGVAALKLILCSVLSARAARAGTLPPSFNGFCSVAQIGTSSSRAAGQAQSVGHHLLAAMAGIQFFLVIDQHQLAFIHIQEHCDFLLIHTRKLAFLPFYLTSNASPEKTNVLPLRDAFFPLPFALTLFVSSALQAQTAPVRTTPH